MISHKSNISTFSIGSLRELIHIALPLMLSSLSSNLMLFFDRLIIAQTSSHAMNAAMTIGITCSVFHFAVSAIASTAEIFVGRYRGSNQLSLLSQPVWQMIWLSFLSIFLFAPLAFFADHLLVPAEYQDIGLPFYHWYMFCGPIFPLVMALTTFYIGQGKTKIITLIMIIGNIVNLLLAAVLVLGLKNVIPSLGLQGAAIATIIAQALQAIILFVLFIKKENRRQYHTSHYRFNLIAMLDCLKIGIPMAIGYIIELGSWAFLLRALTSSGSEYITVFAIGQSLFILFAFISEGMQKSVTVLAANYMGAQITSAITKVLFSAIKLQLLFAIIISLLLLFFADPILYSFVSSDTIKNTPGLHQSLRYALVWFWVFFIFDGIKWIISSILLALEYAVTVVLLNFISIWLFAIIPIYYIVGKLQLPPLLAWVFIVVYSVINMIMLMMKYQFHFRRL